MRANVLRRAAVLCGLVGCVAALAACGSSNSSSSSSTSGSSTSGSGNSSAPAASSQAGKQPIVLGEISDQSGLSAGTHAPFLFGIQTWADWTNAHGGLGGHKIKLLTADSQSQPTAGITAAQKEISQGAIALTSAMNPEPVSLLAADKIPDIGGGEDNPIGGTNPWLFPVEQTVLYLQQSLANTAIGTGNKKIGIVYCTEVAACQVGQKLLASLVVKAGGKVVWSGGTSGTAANYDAPCLAMKAAGVQVLLMILIGAEEIRLVNDCAAQGVHPIIMQTSSSFIPQQLAASGFNHSYVTFQSQSPLNKSYGPVAQFLAAVKQYQPHDLSSPLFNDSATLLGWASGQMLAAALEKSNALGKAKVTTSDVLNGLYALKNETLGGLIAPTTYPQGKGHPDTCSYATRILNGHLVFNNKPTCLPVSQ